MLTQTTFHGVRIYTLKNPADWPTCPETHGKARESLQRLEDETRIKPERVELDGEEFSWLRNAGWETLVQLGFGLSGLDAG